MNGGKIVPCNISVNVTLTLLLKYYEVLEQDFISDDGRSQGGQVSSVGINVTV